jgi:hypothetical protein
MHIPPQKNEKQTVESALADLKGQQQTLASAISWIEEVAKAVRESSSLTFMLATRIMPESRDAQIAFSIQASGKWRDIPIFTIMGSYTREEMLQAIRGDIESIEVLRAIQAQKWLDTYQTRAFDQWLVPETHVWQRDEDVTIEYLAKQTRAWLEYWFGQAPALNFRDRDRLQIDPFAPTVQTKA